MPADGTVLREASTVTTRQRSASVLRGSDAEAHVMGGSRRSVAETVDRLKDVIEGILPTSSTVGLGVLEPRRVVRRALRRTA